MFSQERLAEIKWELDQFIEHPSALKSGTLLNDSHYEIIKLEEVTDRTFVYKALAVDSGELVSIKEFFPKDALGFEDPLYFSRDGATNGLLIKASTPEKVNQFKGLLDAFVDEAKYLEKIAYGDPILRILDAFEDLNTAYIVTNYNRWPSLEELLRQGYVFNVQELDYVLEHVLNVVIRFHRRGIVHRNVTPRSIYIKPDDVIIDSLGSHEFLQDIKIYDADAYRNKYFAPEAVMQGTVDGICADVYAIGKVIIDMISMMTPSKDYLKGLGSLPEDKRQIYGDVVKSAISFTPDDRLQNAMVMKAALFPRGVDPAPDQTPKGMVTIIAMIALISCMFVVWQYGGEAITANQDYDLEEPETPLGALDTHQAVRLMDMEALYPLEDDMLVRWFKNGDVSMHTISVLGKATDYDKTFALQEDSTQFDLSAFRLDSGAYHLVLKYMYQGEIETLQTSFEINE